MTKIERKLKELGYSGRFEIFLKKYKKAIKIYIYAPSDEWEIKEWEGSIVLIDDTINSDEQVKDIQIAWNILKSDLKEIKRMEAKK